MEPRHPSIPAALSRAIDGFGAAYTASDAVAITEFAHEQFQILMMSPQHRSTTREEWLGGFTDYRLLEWDVHDEDVTVRGPAAVHHRRAWRRAASSAGELAGEICVSDHWYLDGDLGWQVWHRFVAAAEPWSGAAG